MRMSVLLCLMMVFAWGCSHSGPDPARDLVRAGENPNDYLVGGGIAIEYRASEPGTAVLLERTSGRIIVTKSLERQELFDVELDPMDADVLEAFRQASGGVPLEDADLRLYFFPAGELASGLAVDEP